MTLDPYRTYRFQLSLGSGPSPSLEAGFDTCDNLRQAGSAHELAAPVEQEAGAHVANVLTLRRGIVDPATWGDWVAQTRGGDPGASRTVTVALQSDDRAAILQTWQLQAARIIKYVSGPMNAKGSATSIEELTLAYEQIAT